MSKMILLVIDSFGIGAMEDAKEEIPGDTHANTYQHIRESVPALNIPTMYHMGLGALLDGKANPPNAFGRSALVHHYADSYMGHQEIAGSPPKKSQKCLMKDIHRKLASVLQEASYDVRYPWADRPVLLVNEAAVIGDNLESTVGNIINVSADFNKISFEEVKKIGRVVRDHVDTSRVIAFGGSHTSIEHVLSVVKKKNDVQWGVDSPKANVYGDGYQVIHMGYGVNEEGQFPMIAARHGLKTYRIGKTADVLQGEGPADPIVDSDEVLNTLKDAYLNEHDNAAFLVNVQETDLAGHAEDANWYADRLNMVDQWLASFLPLMEQDDVIIVMADHGNDPTIGHSNHTREYVPLLINGPKIKSADIGTRQSMADVGATFSDFFNLPASEEGTSFLTEIL